MKFVVVAKLANSGISGLFRREDAPGSFQGLDVIAMAIKEIPRARVLNDPDLDEFGRHLRGLLVASGLSLGNGTHHLKISDVAHFVALVRQRNFALDVARKIHTVETLGFF